MSSARLEIDSQRIATIWLDAPGKRVNTLSRQMWADLSAVLDQIERDKPRGVVIASAKSHSFCVGADLYEIRDMNDEEFDRHIFTGQEILKRLETLPVASVAAVNGDCLGGGFKLAMACTERLPVDRAIKMGLPEVRLGLVPGWGGTVRLTRLAGVGAYSFIAKGELISAESVKAMNIADAPVPEGRLISTAKEMAGALMPTNWPTNAGSKSLSYIEELAKSGERVLSIAGRRAIQVMMEGLKQGPQAGFDAERCAIVELRRTPECQAAMQKFFDR